MAKPKTVSEHPDLVSKSMKADLDESELTAPTDGSASEEGGLGGWLGEFRALAKSTKDTLFPALDGIANMVHRSAMAVAAEIAQLEHEAEADADRWREDNYGSTGDYDTTGPLSLPWELAIRSAESKGEDLIGSVATYAENENLKQKVMELSNVESTFLDPFSSDGSDETDTKFTLNEPRIQLIRRLLALDTRLAKIHAKISGKWIFKENLLLL